MYNMIHTFHTFHAFSPIYPFVTFRVPRFKFGFGGALWLHMPPVGSDALVAPKPQTFCFLMGRGIV